MLHDNILEHVGNTPLVSLRPPPPRSPGWSGRRHVPADRADSVDTQVRADRIAKEYGLKCNLCESLFSSGSACRGPGRSWADEADGDGGVITLRARSLQMRSVHARPEAAYAPPDNVLRSELESLTQTMHRIL